MQRVICVGSASKDIFFPTSEGILFETPQDLTSQVKVAFELGGKFRAANRYEGIGGVAANVSVGLARLGIVSSCYSHLGADDVGRGIKSLLTQEGVNTSLLTLDSSVQSDLSAIIVIEQTGDRIIFHNRDANEKLRIDVRECGNADWLYISSLNGDWRQNVSMLRRAVQTYALHMALNPGQHNIKDDPKLILEWLSEVDVLFLNKDEAIEILLANQVEKQPEKLQDEVNLLRLLREQGPSVVALTDGKRGAWTSDGKSVWHAESFEPYGLQDTTGGGDAFGSGFFAAYLKGFSLETCLQYGICNAGSVVGYYGATPGLLDEQKMISLIHQVKRTKLLV